MSYCVYKHTAPNGKVYIGISKDYKKRWADGEGYRNQKYFYSAIQKYSWENFKHQILADGLTKDEAKAAEVYQIRKHRSNNQRYGYNMTLGGDYREYKADRPCINLDTGLDYLSFREARLDTGVSAEAIKSCCQGRQETAGNYRWAYLTPEMIKRGRWLDL